VEGGGERGGGGGGGVEISGKPREILLVRITYFGLDTFFYNVEWSAVDGFAEDESL